MYKALSPGHIGHSVRFVEVAPAVARAGYEGYWFNIGNDVDGGIERTKALLKEYNLRPAGFDLPVDFRGSEENFEKDLANLTRSLDFAQGVGLTRCATWIFPASDALDYDENFELHRRRLTPVAKLLDERGMVFGLEFCGPQSLRDAHTYPFIHTLQGMLSLCEAIGTGNMGILMDVYHWETAGQKFEDFDLFKSERQVAVVHINDAHENIAFDKLPDTDRRLPGATGVLRIGRFFEGLQKIGYTGPVTVEPFEPFLQELPFEEAISVVMDSINAVWPKA